MSFLDSFSSALPKEITLEYLKQFVPVEWWDEKPEWAAVSALCRCGKFDVQDYLKRYPDVEQTDIDPVLHFVRHGIKENRYFNCMPDTDFGGSKVNLAYKAFKNGEYEKALKMYEELGERIGPENFAANIAICKKKLGNKESVKLLAQNVKSKPKVSVLIPVYNNAQYLHECIDSVINQTLKEIEIIIINDGSTDPESVKILNDYAAKDNRIKLIHKENTGYGHSMNVGLDNATGEYIGIVESDDYIPINMYDELYKKAKFDDIDIIKSDFYRFVHTENNEIKLTLNRLTYDDTYYNKILNPKKDKFVFTFIMNTWSGIYSRKFLKKYDIRHSETPGASFQDNSFWFATLTNANKILIYDKPFYMNRRDNSESSVFNKNKIFAMKYEYDHIYNTLSKNNELKKTFLPEYQYYRYKAYMASLNRSSLEHALDFINQFKQDYELSEAKGEKNLELFSIGAKENLSQIINYPKEFYSNYSIMRKNKDKTNNIFNSNKYKSIKRKVQISVIIPVFNKECHIEKCIDSIISQSLKNIEIICINDGSTDNSIKILEKYDKYDNIIIISQNNQGSGVARNKGLEIANGDYIAFMDADDWYPTYDTLEKLYQNAKNENVMICGGSFSWYKNGQLTTEYSNEIFKKYFFDTKKIIDYKFYQFDYGYTRFIYNNKFIKDNNIFFPNYRRFQDPVFFLKAMVKSKKFLGIPDVVYVYNKTDNTTQYDDEKVYDLVSGLRDNLIISKKYNLEVIHNMNVNRLEKEFFSIISKFTLRNNYKLHEVILSANNSISTDLLSLARGKHIKNFSLRLLDNF